MELILYKFLFFLFLPVLTFANQPTKWQLGFQKAGSPLMEELVSLHDLVFWIITFITLFVFFLLVYVCYRFSSTRNKKPSKVTHNAPLEVAWTLIPVLILIIIGVF